jgi:hypothetical protein
MAVCEVCRKENAGVAVIRGRLVCGRASCLYEAFHGHAPEEEDKC